MTEQSLPASAGEPVRQLEAHLQGEIGQVVFGARQVVTHGPVRLYYIMRNRVLLYRLKQTPRAWIAQDVLRIPFKFVIFAVLVGPRARNTRMMLHGLADGLRGRRGPCPHEVAM